MKKTTVLFFTIITLLFSCKSSQRPDLGDGIFANIETNKGDILLRLEHEKTPITVANFISLAEGVSPFVSDSLKGKKYYDGVIFHRVIKDFMIQSGDPTGTGRGNPGYKFKDEFSDSLRHSKAGIISMANSGFATNGSQFFITHKETPFLDAYDENGFLKPCENPRVSCHSVFGEVIEGMEVVNTIATTETSQEPATKNRPVSEIVMNTVQIIRNGKAAKNFDAVQVMSDYFAAEEAAIAAMQKFLSEFVAQAEQQKDVAETLPSGLKIYNLQKGTGEKPKIGQYVKVNYAGWLSNGTLFDTSSEEIAKKFGKFGEINAMHRGDFSPSSMLYSPESPLVGGFREGLLSMGIGDKIRIFIPPHLGYGASGGGPIPPNANLIFDLEIVEIDQPQN